MIIDRQDAAIVTNTVNQVNHQTAVVAVFIITTTTNQIQVYVISASVVTLVITAVTALITAVTDNDYGCDLLAVCLECCFLCCAACFQ